MEVKIRWRDPEEFRSLVKEVTKCRRTATMLGHSIWFFQFLNETANYVLCDVTDYVRML